jgi:tetratricopeptide (TPR) repeat protein
MAAFCHAKGRDELELENYSKAEESLNKAISFRGDVGKYKSSLGYCYLKQGKKEEAEQLLFTGFKQSPWWFKGNKYLADYLMEEKRYDEALIPLKQLQFFDTNEAIELKNETRAQYLLALKNKSADKPDEPNPFLSMS